MRHCCGTVLVVRSLGLALTLTLAAPAALLGLLLVAPASTPAAVSAGGTRVRIFAGNCDSLVIAGRRGPKGCRAQLVNMTYRSGVVSFVFADGTGRLVSFRGRVGAQVGSQTTLKVDQVTLVPRGGSQALVSPALGSCVLTPFAADRSRLECSARARGARYSALFRTSGAPQSDVTL